MTLFIGLRRKPYGVSIVSTNSQDDSAGGVLLSRLREEMNVRTDSENVLWVTEVWNNQGSHDASLSLPAVKNAIPQAKGIVSNFEKIAVMNPVWGAGLPMPHQK